MLQNFSNFYRQLGIRTISDLFNPTMQAHIEMPQSAVLHYTAKIAHDDKDLEMDLSAPFLSSYNKKLPIRYITNYNCSTLGSFVTRAYDVNSHSKHWLKDNYAKVTRVKEDYPLSADRTLLNLINYSYLYKINTYTDTTMTRYHIFNNQYGTMFKTIHDYTKVSEHEHFIELEVPEDLPSVSMFNMYQDNINPSYVKLFDTDEKMLIMEFWKWFNPETRSTSMLHYLETSNLHKVVFIFINKSGECTYLNLAYINSWIHGEKPLKAGSISQIKYQVMQKVFLNFLINMNSSVKEEEIPVKTTTTAPTDINYDAPIEGDVTETSDNDDLATGIKKHNPNTTGIANKFKDVKQLSDSGKVDTATMDKKLKEMEETLKLQENKAKEVLREKGEILDETGEVVEEKVVPLTIEEITNIYLSPKEPLDYVKATVETLGSRKDISAADYRNMLKRIQASSDLPNPYNEKVKLYDTKINIEEAVIDKDKSSMNISEISRIVDPSMDKSSLNDYTSAYVTKLLKKEIVGVIASFGQANVLTKNYEVYREDSALGSYETHNVVLQPIEGPASPIVIKIPVVSEDGSYIAGGNKYSMRAQRIDMPIRKVKPIEVALTSYYGKTFVGLSEKKAQSHSSWLLTKIYQIHASEPDIVKELSPSDVFDNYNDAPALYNLLAHNFRSLRIQNISFEFSYKERANTLSVDQANIDKLWKEDKIYVCGINDKNELVGFDINSNLCTRIKNMWMPSGTMYTLLNIAEKDGPMDASFLNVFAKAVPVGLVLAYRLGLHNLLTLLQSKYGIQYRFVEGKRLTDIGDQEYSIRFSDGFLVLTRGDKTAQYIMAGFTYFEKETKLYPIKEFYHKFIYLNLLKAKGLSTIYLNEIDNLFDMFVDPITKRLLADLKEPQTFEGLLIRATELLKTYEYPDSQDMRYQRIRGYERFAGVMYSQISSSIRAYRNKINKTRSKIDMSPFQVMQTIMKDPANKIVEDINPIQNVKHSEIVTYVGEGGRDKSTLNKKSRAYVESDLSIISEATVDSSDVGVNVYMPPNPNFSTVYGNRSENTKLEASNLLSTATMLAPGSTYDDAKRTGFVSIQQSHTVATTGYHAPILRTGYETVIGQRTSDMFCCAAKDDGVVKSINDKGLIIEYKDGTTKGVKLGTVYGKAEGAMYPHPIVAHADMKVGYKFKKGQVLAYNTGFFDIDTIDPTSVVFKNSLYTWVMYTESAKVHEDSCSITPELSKKLDMKASYTRSIILNFTDSFSDLVKLGTRVMPNSPLMIIHDEITSVGGYSDQAYESLKKLSSQTPKAKYKGVVEKIEVFYHGDKEDMSDSIRAVTDTSDKNRAAIARSCNDPIVTGRVNDDYRVDGVSLSLDKVEIKIYITSEIGAGVADKVVLCNQLKSVIGEVRTSPIRAANGTIIDVEFSYRGVAKRITNSPMFIGIISTVSYIRGIEIANMTS